MVMISRPLDHVQALPHWQARLLLERLSVLPPHLGRVHVCGGLCVGLGQHGHHAQQDLLYALHGGPPLAARLVPQRVVTRRVQDAVVKNNHCKCTVVTILSNITTYKTIKMENILSDYLYTSPDANSSVRINIRVKELWLEPHFRRVKWVILGEGESGNEHAILEVCSLWSRDGSFPLEEVVLCDGSRCYTCNHTCWFCYACAILCDSDTYLLWFKCKVGTVWRILRQLLIFCHESS